MSLYDWSFDCDFVAKVHTMYLVKISLKSLTLRAPSFPFFFFNAIFSWKKIESVYPVEFLTFRI